MVPKPLPALLCDGAVAAVCGGAVAVAVASTTRSWPDGTITEKNKRHRVCVIY